MKLLRYGIEIYQYINRQGDLLEEIVQGHASRSTVRAELKKIIKDLDLIEVKHEYRNM